MPIQHSNSNAFSLIELVFIIAIVGILVFVLPRELNIPQRACYAKLASQLASLQQNLSIAYTKATLSLQNIPQNDVLTIIESFRLESKHCFLGFEKSKFVAKAFSEKTTFTLEPSDLSVQPSFKCPFSSNALCREILERTKTK